MVSAGAKVGVGGGFHPLTKETNCMQRWDPSTVKGGPAVGEQAKGDITATGSHRL